MSKALPYLKSIYGSTLTALGALATEYITTHTVTWAGGITIAIAYFTSLGVIWGVPNLPSQVNVSLHLADRAIRESEEK